MTTTLATTMPTMATTLATMATMATTMATTLPTNANNHGHPGHHHGHHPGHHHAQQCKQSRPPWPPPLQCWHCYSHCELSLACECFLSNLFAFHTLWSKNLTFHFLPGSNPFWLVLR